jgi:hypothetical protein
MSAWEFRVLGLTKFLYEDKHEIFFVKCFCVKSSLSSTELWNAEAHVFFFVGNTTRLVGNTTNKGL